MKSYFLKLIGSIFLFFGLSSNINAQVMVYQKDNSIILYNISENIKTIIKEENNADLKGYNISNQKLLIYTQKDTIHLPINANWDLHPLPTIKIEKYGSMNTLKISDSLSLKEYNWNIVLCNRNNEQWRVIGNKTGYIPNCNENQLFESSGSYFQPVLSKNNKYLAFSSIKKGFLGGNKMFIINMNTGKQIHLKGFNPIFSNAGSYLLYQSNNNGKFNIFDIENNRMLPLNSDKAFWINH